MARLGGLGKGLGALIPSESDMRSMSDQDPTGDDDRTYLAELDIDSLTPNPNQPRLHFDEVTLADLAASIREIGVLQPVLARDLGNGTYQLVAGERRWRFLKKHKMNRNKQKLF